MKKLLFATVASGLVLGGCTDPGSAPPGMSDSDAKAAIQNMNPEDRIRAIASSPMSQGDKEKQYAEIEASTGVKASEVLKGQPRGVGAGG